MRRYTIFTKDELWDMLDGKKVVSSDKDGTVHVYISEEGFVYSRYSDEENEDGTLDN